MTYDFESWYSMVNQRKRGDKVVSIAELRARNGKMSQDKLAKDLGVKQSQISRWEENPLSMSSKNLIKIALYFGVTTDELLDVKGAKENFF